MSGKEPRRPGHAGSRNTAQPSKHDILFPPPELQQALGAVYDDWRAGEGGPPQAREDFIFHMADWFTDLAKLAAFYQHPEQFPPATASKLIFGFLVHALPHLNAAGRLLLNEIADPFAAPDQTAAEPGANGPQGAGEFSARGGRRPLPPHGGRHPSR